MVLPAPFAQRVHDPGTSSRSASACSTRSPLRLLGSSRRVVRQGGLRASPAGIVAIKRRTATPCGDPGGGLAGRGSLGRFGGAPVRGIPPNLSQDRAPAAIPANRPRSDSRPNSAPTPPRTGSRAYPPLRSGARRGHQFEVPRHGGTTFDPNGDPDWAQGARAKSRAALYGPSRVGHRRNAQTGTAPRELGSSRPAFDPPMAPPSLVRASAATGPWPGLDRRQTGRFTLNHPARAWGASR